MPKLTKSAGVTLIVNEAFERAERTDGGSASSRMSHGEPPIEPAVEPEKTQSPSKSPPPPLPPPPPNKNSEPPEPSKQGSLEPPSPKLSGLATLRPSCALVPKPGPPKPPTPKPPPTKRLSSGIGRYAVERAGTSEPAPPTEVHMPPAPAPPTEVHMPPAPAPPAKGGAA